MRLYSLRSIISAALCTLLIVAAILALPVIVPLALIAAVIVPGLSLLHRTNDFFTLNLASYHSPHRREWSWCLSFIRPRSADDGRWLCCYAYGDDCTWRGALQIARCQVMLTRQLYHRRAEHWLNTPPLAGRSS